MMEWRITFFSIVLFFFAGLTVYIGSVTWRRRLAPGSLPLAWLLWAAAEWMLAQGLESAVVGIPFKIILAKIEYLGITTTPLLLLWFAVEFSRQEKLTLRWVHSFFAAMPVLTLGLVATNEWHHLVWARFIPAPDINSNLMLYEYGVWFWIFVVYQYVLILAASMLVIRSALRSNSLYRSQAISLLAALPLPWLGNIVYIFKLGNPGEDLTPVGFGAAGMILAWSIYRLKLFDLSPVARERVIEWMDDALIVVDRKLRVVDINPAAARLLAQVEPQPATRPHARLLGRPAREVLANLPPLLERLEHAEDGEFEFQAQPPQSTEPGLEFQGRISALYDRDKALAGWLAILHDISALNQARNDAYEARDQALAAAAENYRLYEQMKQMALTDPLTGLSTRRHFFSLSAQAFEKARIKEQPLCAIMIDLDHFKAVNDRYGHAAGDRMLQLVAWLCQDSLRKIDLIGHYGGEEFIALLPETHLAQAAQMAERLRARIAATELDTGTEMMKVTVSMGVAEGIPALEPLESLIDHADQALYDAKHAGRNQVKCYNDASCINLAEGT